jgi:hypothetical protein
MQFPHTAYGLKLREQLRAETIINNQIILVLIQKTSKSLICEVNDAFRTRPTIFSILSKWFSYRELVSRCCKTKCKEPPAHEIKAVNRSHHAGS